jgi:3-isopropylmalate/(R)-2-methylmalate dehydratase large subunit
MEAKTLFDKTWDAHVVEPVEGDTHVLYIDRHYIHEVTSPVAFQGLEKRGLTVFRPEQTTATPDHNIPTREQHRPIADPQSRQQVERLRLNCEKYGITHYGLGTEGHGIVHIIGPEKGLTLPGITIVCGDSHTSTHGAFGAVAFGIGTSEVEMVLASQCIVQPKPKKMRIRVEGELAKGVTAKDIILYIISRITTSGGTGHFIEFSGSAIRTLSMEGRMTVCNMSIESGARGGMVAPDEITFAYIKGREFAPAGRAWTEAVNRWKELKSDENARFDAEYCFDASHIEPMVTFGTNPGMGMPLSGRIPDGNELTGNDKRSFEKALRYMDFKAGEPIKGKRIDYVFLGSCTNGRIEDFRAFAEFVRGKKKADRVIAWLVPGSKQVETQIRTEGLDAILEEAGFSLRQPGCSACLAMNEDKIPEGKYAVSTSNRNFEGRQGPGARTILASPLTAAAAAVTGVISDPREHM